MQPGDGQACANNPVKDLSQCANPEDLVYKINLVKDPGQCVNPIDDLGCAINPVKDLVCANNPVHGLGHCSGARSQEVIRVVRILQ